MRRLIATALSSTVVAAVLAGCGSNADDPAPGGAPTIVESHRATLTVATSYSEGRNGALYIEGALARLVLRDSDGNVAGAATHWPGKKFVFADLDPGTYVLEPALRPCDGNCGYLDGPTDACRETLSIDGDMGVRVDFTVGEPCVVAAAARG